MSSSTAASEIPGRACVVGIGEILWDLLPEGPSLGGAPCNVMVNLARLGHDAVFVTAVGDDELGRAARHALVALGLDTSFVLTVERRTGQAGVVLDGDGIPEFRIAPDDAYSEIDLSAADVTALASTGARAIVYGTLAQRSPQVRASTAALARALPGAMGVYDVNLRPGLWDDELVRHLTSMASVVKLNEEEARLLAPVFGAPWPDPETFSRALAASHGLRAVAVTAGPKGASLLLDGAYAEAPAPEVDAANTIGAGDAFTAAMIDGILRDLPANVVLGRSISLGTLIASRQGALPQWTVDDLREFEQRTADRLDQPSPQTAARRVTRAAERCPPSQGRRG
jgi:fructokinase